MSTAATIAVVVIAGWVGFSAYAAYTQQAWVVDNLADYGVPRSWWPWLATAKAGGAVGLVAGLAVPAVGVAAAVGLVIYFTGAAITVLRARAFTHVAFPLLYLVPALVAGFLVAGS